MTVRTADVGKMRGPHEDCSPLGLIPREGRKEGWVGLGGRWWSHPLPFAKGALLQMEGAYEISQYYCVFCLLAAGVVSVLRCFL